MTALNVLLGKLQHVKESLDLSDCVLEALKFPQDLEKIVAVVERRIDQGAYILDEPLTALIIASRSQSLFGRVRNRLLKNDWAVIDLYKAGFDEPELESLLSKALFAIYSDDGEPKRSYIVDAMASVGNEEILPTLEAILDDVGPSAKIRSIFQEKMDVLSILKIKSRSEFAMNVARAIDNIKARARSPQFREPAVFTLYMSEEPPQSKVSGVSGADHHRMQAQKLLDVDPEAALNALRKAAESLAKECFTRCYPDEKRPVSSFELQELIDRVKSRVPKILEVALRTVQNFGNLGSHDQGEDRKLTNKQVAFHICGVYDTATNAYTAWIVSNDFGAP